MTLVNVDLGPRSYDIIIKEGLLSEVGSFISQKISRGKIAIISDENVYKKLFPGEYISFVKKHDEELTNKISS